jgi:RNA polymerase sigma-70 factor (ECF subfamily)
MLSQAEFVSLLTASQRRMYGFICTLVVDPADAEDVLQETNLALWEQIDRFEPGTDFVAWGCRVAHFKVLKLRDAAKRHRVRLDEQVIELLASEAIASQRAADADAAQRFEATRLALVACMDKLPCEHRDVLLRRYQARESLASIGASIGRTGNAVAQLLHRIRVSLRTCIQRRLADSAPCTS